MTNVIYSRGSQECERAKSLLLRLEGELLEYNLGVDFSDRQFRSEFGSEAEFPQIAIGSKHIGSLKETLQYFQTNNLL